MRNKIKYTLFILAMFFGFVGHAQMCPPSGDVILNTQTEVDDFINQYNACTIIDGNLFIISVTSGDVINDISRLDRIIQVKGDLVIDSFVTNLDNFDDLERVEGNLQLVENSKLENINGFNKLTYFENMIIGISDSLTEVNGFESLASIGGELQILGNPLLKSVSGFSLLQSTGSQLVIFRNPELETMPSFHNLISIGDKLVIEENTKLVTVNGFDNLETIGEDLRIGSSIITSINGFGKLREISGGVNISSFFPRTHSPNLTTIPDFDALETIGDGLYICNSGIRNISGFNNVTSFTGDFIMLENANLETISGFSNLIELKGGIEISQNSDLTSLSGFSNLITIDNELQITNNNSISTLLGLQSLGSVAELLDPSLTGVDISNNLSLTNCSAICNLLTNGTVGGIVRITNNPSKCSSEAEVIQDCIDFDNDGVLDTIDLDDDNDGILDTEEQNGDPNRDSDSDGNPDRRDLDSDNDGCLDVIEAGFTDGDGNGTLGSLPDLVDTNGLITGAPDGYTSPLDANSNGINDFQEDIFLNPGTDGNLTVCENNGLIDLFDSLGGVPDTGGVWSPSLTSNSGVFDPSVDAAGIYTYTLNNGVCGSESARVTVSIEALPNSGTNGVLQICDNAMPTDLFVNLGGTPDTGGVWTPSLTGGTGFFNPALDAAGTYTYTVSNGVCNPVSSQVTVTVNASPNSGLDGNLSICVNNNEVDLFDSLGGNPESGGVWSPPLISGTGTFDPSQDASGIYTYTVSNGSCVSTSAQVNVTIFNNYEIQDFTIETTSFSANNSIIVTINSIGVFEYSLDGINYQTSNTFNNLSGGNYTVQVREVNGCGSLLREISILDYPKFFTPNNDGINDVWELKGISDQEYSISIYNRFGKLVKVLKDKNESWDGTANGYKLTSNDYWFRIQFTDGRIVRGNFSLLRR
ncbi:MAG: T9SS type B sorting domain-containing protein [Flavobacteriaceae bacterium]